MPALIPHSNRQRPVRSKHTRTALFLIEILGHFPRDPRRINWFAHGLQCTRGDMRCVFLLNGRQEFEQPRELLFLPQTIRAARSR